MRKNTILILSVLVFIIFQGCEKNEELLNTNSDGPTNIEIYEKNGMLVFPDIETVQNVMQQLETENNEFSSKFSEQVTGMDNDAVEEFISKNSWNKNQVFENFEKKFEFTSLRQVINNKMLEFNKIYDQTGIENPDDHFLRNPFLRTLVNENCMFMIGTSIYKFLENGAVIEVLKENYTIANEVNTENFMNYDFKTEINIDYDYGEKQLCNKYGSFDWYALYTLGYDSKTIRFSVRCDVDNNIFARNIRGVAKAEYWDNQWKNYTAYKIAVRPDGYVRKDNCSSTEYHFAKEKSNPNDNEVSETAPVRIEGRMQAFAFTSGKVGVYATIFLNANYSKTGWQFIYW